MFSTCDRKQQINLARIVQFMYTSYTSYCDTHNIRMKFYFLFAKDWTFLVTIIIKYLPRSPPRLSILHASFKFGKFK